MSDSKSNRRKSLKGIVIPSKMDKTIIVKVERSYPHRVYKKYIKKTKKYYVHDENNIFSGGEQVTIRETRPISKLKRWEVCNSDNKRQE